MLLLKRKHLKEHLKEHLKKIKKNTEVVGFEPTTSRFRDECSTN